MFRGTHYLTLDDKGRVPMPAKFRQPLTESCGGELIVVPSLVSRCLWIFPLPEWEKIEERVSKLSSFDANAEHLKSVLIGYATDVTLDSHGRFLVQPEHRAYAQLGKQVALAGQGNKFALWDESAWRAQWEDLQQNRINLTALADKLADLGL